jgi:GNAT superfamily N-acetyltransferase
MSTRSAPVIARKKWQDPEGKTVTILLRGIREGDLDTITKWMEEEGWTPGEYDVAIYFKAFKEKFVVAVKPESPDIPLGCILIPQYGQDAAFLGLFMVAKDKRRIGLGRAVWDAATEQLSTRDTTLYAVEAQVERYEKAGFVIVGDTIRYQSRENPERPSENSTPIIYDIPREELRSLATLRPQDGDDEKKREWRELCNNLTNWLTESKYCTKHVNADFIDSLLSHNGVTAVIKTGSGNAIKGLATLRPCRGGDYRLSMFASDEKSAMELAIQVMREINFDAYRRIKEAPQPEEKYEPKDALGIFMDSINPENPLVKQFVGEGHMEFMRQAGATFKIMRKRRGIEQEKACAERFSITRHSLFSPGTSASTVPEPSATEESVVNIGVLSLEAG